MIRRMFIMEMTMRWYGKEYDTVTLQQIRQSCYVKGIISIENTGVTDAYLEVVRQKLVELAADMDFGVML